VIAVKPAMIIDLKKCVGCGACTAACVMENQYKEGKPLELGVIGELLSKVIKLRKYEGSPLEEAIKRVESGESPEEVLGKLFMTRTNVIRLEWGKYPNVRAEFWHRICRHCEDAPCAHVCPTRATYVTKDGVVMVDKNKCILCGACIVACPYAARGVDVYSRAVDKCTLCYHRIRKGLLPACVETCPTGARSFGDLDDPTFVSKIPKEKLEEGERVIILE